MTASSDLSTSFFSTMRVGPSGISWLKPESYWEGKVLISPISIDRKQKTDGLTLSLTKEQIRNSADIDTDKPVSRQHEAQYFNYYGYQAFVPITTLLSVRSAAQVAQSKNLIYQIHRTGNKQTLTAY